MGQSYFCLNHAAVFRLYGDGQVGHKCCLALFDAAVFPFRVDCQVEPKNRYSFETIKSK